MVSEAILTSTHNLCFEQKYENGFLSENFHFLVVKFSVYLNRRDFVICSSSLLLSVIASVLLCLIISYSFGTSVRLCFMIITFHYENTPIQIYRKFYPEKLKIFR